MRTYDQERECRDCGSTYTAAVYIGVGRDSSGGRCQECYSEHRQEKIERGLGEFPDMWYRPDSEEFEICLYKPDGDRRYYRHDIHAVQRIEAWYGE